MAGGHDTSAATLAWCFERILHHPEVLARCREDGSDEYPTAVVSETLRVRPPIDAASRKLSAPFELGGYRLPATTIGQALFALNTDHAVMIGDRSFDIIGAHAHSIPAIGVSWGIGTTQELATSGAEAIIDQPSQLPSAVSDLLRA